MEVIQGSSEVFEDGKKRYSSLLLPVPEHSELLNLETTGECGESYNATGCTTEECNTVKAVPMTTKQQVLLWLSRVSADRLHRGPSLGSVKNFTKNGLGGKHRNIFSKSRLSTKSLADPPMTCGSPCEPKHSDLKKCATELVFTNNPDRVRSIHRQLNDSTRRGTNDSRVTKVLGRDSERVSHTLLNISKWGSDVFSRGLTSQHTAPGCLSNLQGRGDSFLHGFQGLRPVNRLRSTSSNLKCSACSSMLSIQNKESSQMSLNLDGRKNKMFYQEEDQECKICLGDFSNSDMVTLKHCQCSFCKECMRQYVTQEIMCGEYEISCPDPECSIMGVLHLSEVESLTDTQLLEKHKSFRLNTEVSKDISKMWCPVPSCGRVCDVPPESRLTSTRIMCPECQNQFCSCCRATWHHNDEGEEHVCEEEGAGMGEMLGESIKLCPACHVPIERDEGCAQMMCRSCKHVFCWFCLESLDVTHPK